MSYFRTNDRRENEMGSSARDGRDRELYHAVYNSLQNVQDSFHRLQTAIRPMPPRYSPFPEQRRISQNLRRPSTGTPRIVLIRHRVPRQPRPQCAHAARENPRANRNWLRPRTSAFQQIHQPGEFRRPHIRQMTRVPAADEDITGHNEDAFNAEHWSKVLSDTIHKWRKALNKPQQIPLSESTKSEYKMLRWSMKACIAQLSFQLEIDRATLDFSSVGVLKPQRGMRRFRRHSR